MVMHRFHPHLRPNAFLSGWSFYPRIYPQLTCKALGSECNVYLYSQAPFNKGIPVHVPDIQVSHLHGSPSESAPTLRPLTFLCGIGIFRRKTWSLKHTFMRACVKNNNKKNENENQCLILVMTRRKEKRSVHMTVDRVDICINEHFYEAWTGYWNKELRIWRKVRYLNNFSNTLWKGKRLKPKDDQ